MRGHFPGVKAALRRAGHRRARPGFGRLAAGNPARAALLHAPSTAWALLRGLCSIMAEPQSRFVCTASSAPLRLPRFVRPASPMSTPKPARLARPPRKLRGSLRACLTPLAAALALAGCASGPARRPGTGMQVPVNISSSCYAPAPNPNAGYNRDYRVLGHDYAPLRSASGYEVEGTASWYGWESGRTTAMGTYFNPRAFTAASRVLPLPTCVEVTNLRNGRSVLVLVDDRGPFVDSRVMDLSYGAARALGMTATGTAPVRIVALAPGVLQSNPQDNGAPPPPASAQAGPQGAAETFAPMRLTPPAQAVELAGAGTQAASGQSLQITKLAPLQAQSPQASPAPGARSGLPASPPPTASDALAALIASSTAGSTPSAPPAAPTASQPSASPPMPPAAQAAASAPGTFRAAAAATPRTAAASSAPGEALPATEQAQAPMPSGAPQPYVQTGAFTIEYNARQEARRLERAGLGPVEVVPGYVHGRTWYKVQIGPLPPNAPDRALRDHLARLGLRNYTFVQQ